VPPEHRLRPGLVTLLQTGRHHLRGAMPPHGGFVRSVLGVVRRIFLPSTGVEEAADRAAEHALPTAREGRAPSAVEKRYRLIDRMNLNLLLENENLLDRTMMDVGVWEEQQLLRLDELAHAFVARTSRSKIFIDVGAHWGLYALKMHQTGVFDRILAFEADAHNFAQLQAELFLNDCAYDIESYNLALSSVDQELTMLRATGHPLGNRAGAGIFDSEEKARAFFSAHGCAKDDRLPMAVRKVRAAPLDDLVSLKDSAILIKIDVEGHEKEVLKGMKRLMANNRIIFQIEVLPDQDWTYTALEQEFGLTCFASIAADFYFSNFGYGKRLSTIAANPLD
jgi:FkbM family methyltransferase